MQKGIFVKDMAAPNEAEGVFVITLAAQGSSRNGPYWRLVLADASGSVEAKIWSPLSASFPALHTGSFFYAHGRVSTFRDQLQFTVEEGRLLSPEEGAALDLADFMPASPYPLDAMMDELMGLIREEFRYKPWRKLVDGVFKNEELREAFRTCPAAKGVHHAYAGGLLEHTLSVFKLCRRLADQYPELDRQTLLAGALFHDFGKIRDILVQKRVSMEQNFANAGHTAAMAHVASYYLPAAVVREQIDGVGFYRFLKRTLATFDNEKETLATKLVEVARRIFTDDNCTIGFTGKDDDFNRVMGAGMATGRTGEPGCTARLVVPEPQVPATGEAFAVPTDVTYTALGFDRRLLGVPYSGAWLVASRALSYDFLWNEVRVKGGAYGAGFSPTRTGNLRFYSYRDPHVDETLERFRAAGAWLSDFSPSEPEMDGYIVSTVAGLDAPLKPRELARRQDGYVFAHIDPAERLVTRSQVANATIEEVRALGDAVSQAASKNIACVFGNREIIESAKADFTVVDLLGE